MKIQFGLTLVTVVFLSFDQPSNAQTGGSFDLSHNVIAGGGGSNSTGGTFVIDGTIGQPQAGTVSGGGNFELRGGFWAYIAPAATAARVSVTGRVVINGSITTDSVRNIINQQNIGIS
jgi:hypothetical protein